MLQGNIEDAFVGNNSNKFDFAPQIKTRSKSFKSTYNEESDDIVNGSSQSEQSNQSDKDMSD